MTRQSRVLLVEDDTAWLEIYSAHLNNEDYFLETARTVQQAFTLLEQNSYDAVVTDLKMLGFGEDFGGFSVLQKTKELSPGTQVVVITAYGTQELAFRATQQGAYDYVVKPPVPDKFRMSIKRAILASRQLASRKGSARTTVQVSDNQSVKKKPSSIATRSIGRKSIIGNSPQMQTLFEQMSAASTSMSSVLVWGEPGTGKRLLAKAIHASSHTGSTRFSAISCAKLVEYQEAIFKNVNSSYLRDGTLFLHDLSLLGKAGQLVLKELLEIIDLTKVRLIASLTTKESDLPLTWEKENIRQSIVFAFAKLPIFVPPLRHRKEDIPALAGHFINLLVPDSVPIPQISLSEEAITLLLKHEYRQANVRELRTILQDTVQLMGGQGQILPEHLPALHKKNVPTMKEERTFTTTELRQVLDTYFNTAELRNLCHDLKIDYESLGGVGKSEKAREIVTHCERHGFMSELIQLCIKLRPNISI